MLARVKYQPLDIKSIIIASLAGSGALGTAALWFCFVLRWSDMPYDHVLATGLWCIILSACLASLVAAVIWRSVAAGVVSAVLVFTLVAPVARTIIVERLLPADKRARQIMWLPHDAQVVEAVADDWGDGDATVVFRLPASKSHDTEAELIANRMEGQNVRCEFNPLTGCYSCVFYHVG